MTKNTDRQVAVRAKNIAKDFHLPHEKSNSLKSTIINIFKKKDKEVDVQHALRDVSFDVYEGEFFGIVGRNGSGKSTLLKIISEIYQPTKGSIEVQGKLVPFIELGVGFNPELTGRENVFLNGALLGFSQSEMEKKYDQIVEFAELEEFMDQKLKNYSSGMQVRLAFSVAIQADGDILILDEVLAVGDEAFQRKCSSYFADIKKAGKTIVLVTHDMETVRRYCSRALFIRDGLVALAGMPEDVANEYSIENLDTQDQLVDSTLRNAISDFNVELLSPRQIRQGEQVKIRVSYKTSKTMETYPVCDLKDLDRGVPLVTAGCPPTKERSVSRVWTVGIDEINNTNVIVNVVVRDKNNDIIAFKPESESPGFIVRRDDYPNPKKPTTYALLFNKGKWS